MTVYEKIVSKWDHAEDIPAERWYLVRQGILVLAGFVLIVNAAVAQEIEPADSSEYTPAGALSLDERLSYSIYALDAPILEGVLHGIDRTVYGVFVSGPIAVWGYEWVKDNGRSLAPAYRLFVSEAVASVTYFAIKRIVLKPRPYDVLPGILRRRTGDRRAGLEGDYTFPSGHSAIAFSMATSLFLSYPEWYVLVPGLVWASGVGVSRVWLGLHYPSDVIAGALLGVAVGTGVHLARDLITPSFLKGDLAPDQRSPVISFSIRF